MIVPPRSLAALYLLLCFALRATAAIVVDDAWSDGTRTDPASPVCSEQGADADNDGNIESAWYQSSDSLSVAPGAMTAVTSTSNRTWWTYFTKGGAGPAALDDGATLKASLAFTANEVSASNLKRGFSVGLYDFSGGARTVSSSGSPSGTNVKGYLLNVNLSRAFGIANPLELRQRTALTSSALMSSSSDYTTLGQGGGAAGDEGFVSGEEYTLEFSAKRTGAAIEITTRITGPDGFNISQTGTVSGANAADAASFDGFAVRTSKTSETATSFAFTRFRVEVIPGAPAAPTISAQPQSQNVTAGQSAAFSVTASGSAPLTYQWRKGGVAIAGATASALTLPSVQSADAGAYSVVVTNGVGSVTSQSAALTVATPTPASITTPPQSQTVAAGQGAVFRVSATGSAPLSYQWKKDGANIPGANDAALTLANVQAADAGNYAVTVSNAGGGATSAAAALTVTPAAPVILTQPQAQAAKIGGSASFSVSATGTQPFAYEWRKDGAALAGAPNGPTLSLSNLQTGQSGAYSVRVSNAAGAVVSAAASLSVTAGLPDTAYNLAGFAQAATGGGIVAETDAKYRKVYNAADLFAALNDSAAKVIEIMNDLNLGYNELPASAQTGIFTGSIAPLTHPVLLSTGVTTINLTSKNGLTIFSANGATIRHAEFNIKRSTNLIIRNLRFDELWEWDESSKGNYDRNDWDMMTVDMGSTNIWIDHCDFGKAYDGIVDIKGGSNNITLSWCRMIEDDGGPNSWVRRQINALEANRTAYSMYNFLRSNGFSVDDIVDVMRPQKKTHLVGATEFASDNAKLSVTIHHNLYVGLEDRLPRLRAGNAHVYNTYVDDRNVYATSLVYNQRVAAMTPANAVKLTNGSYHFGVTQNASISTEGGAVLVEKSYYDGARYALRNNQADVTDASYTGKIRAVDMIYHFADINFRGGSDDANHPLGPTQAPVIAFSFNGFTTLPYAYTPDDPAQLPDILALGAGAGKLTWDKSNWLKTAYAAATPAAPSIANPPVSQSAGVGAGVTFNVAAGGAAPLSYQWRKGGVNIPGATAAALTLSNLQFADAGAYSALVSNAQGSVVSDAATLTVLPSYISWQQGNFSAAEQNDPAVSGPLATPAGDGVTNLMRYALGLAPRAPVPAGVMPQAGADSGGPVFIYHRLANAPDVTYQPQASADLQSWGAGNVTAQRTAAAGPDGLETWAARYNNGGGAPGRLFFRLQVAR